MLSEGPRLPATCFCKVPCYCSTTLWLLQLLLADRTLPLHCMQQSPFATLKAASEGLTVQDFSGATDGGEYWPSLRVYMPYAPVGSSLKPIMLFMHGGGWIR
eukprot:TRINITY_DN1460_c0_g1_i2.p2 TRINITY_DN1460_c0_g1~~TRINITY_DN1460_c0_g1_i2.p2  ORF type:complete len:102 (-),score=9.30 TRINITY_DN1460_c0_g1_i2:447-752(-)